MVVFIVAGTHIPVIPFKEVPGRIGGVLFRKRGPIWINAGMICGSIVMFIVVVTAHCPAPGVKV